MGVYLLLVILLSQGEVTDANPVESVETSSGMSSVEMANKYCANTHMATLEFRKSMKGFNRKLWSKETEFFQKDCEQGFLLGMKESKKILPSNIQDKDIEKNQLVIEKMCHEKIRQSKPLEKSILAQNIGCLYASYLLIINNLATKK
ncbi:hypothetical protein K2X05_03500 [bacterium]|nr:hypothetical protein [bacterium]